MSLPHLRDIPIRRLADELRGAGLESPEPKARMLALAMHRRGALDWADLRAGFGRRTEARLARLEGRLDGLARGLSQLEREFDVTVQRLETAVRFDMPVYFAFDRANLRPEDLPVLDRFAGVVGEYYPDALLTVEGFTDPSGSATYNLALGKRRAEAVQRYLIETENFSPEHVRTVSYGEDTARLVSPGQSGQKAGWENRRVVLVIEHVGYGSDTPMIIGGGK